MTIFKYSMISNYQMKLTYRPEIDGLRAIAVGAVILYHANISGFGHQLFKGGFIGVDIFFVISGYLITSIILKEIIKKDSFSFIHFYERRIRRILPALLFVMLVSFQFAWIYLLPSNFIDFSKSILYSIGFSSNFFFHYSGLIYGAENALYKPFLHTWSLSIEEQFYILFPISLWIVFRYLKKYLIHVLILGFLISLFLAEWTSRNYPSLSFYFLHTRMYELLAGSILAYIQITKGQSYRYKALNFILPIIGLALIGHSILFFNDRMLHPSILTLSPIIGVCLIIWFANRDGLVTKILSSKLFVGVGLISYSLYLWHYPIFAFARIIEFTKGNFLKELLLGVIILILSITSYYFIERPARNKDNKFKVIISLIITSIFILVISISGYKNRLPQLFEKNISEKTWNLLKDSNGKICHTNICEFNKSSKKKVYIVGDSHMGSLIFDLKERVVKNDHQFITMTMGCLFTPGFNSINIKTKKINDVCKDSYFQNLKQLLLKDKNSIIIFGGRFPLWLSNNFFNNQEGGVEKGVLDSENISVGKYSTIQESIKNELLEISKQNKIILIYPIPEVGLNPKKRIYNQWVKEKFPKNFKAKKITTSYKVFKTRTRSSFELLDSIKGDNIYRVYPHKLFCETTIKNRCITHDQKNIFYSDEHHPSLKGAEMINELIMKEIKKINHKTK